MFVNNRAETNARNYRVAAKAKVASQAAIAAMNKELQSAKKKLTRHKNKTENVMAIRRERNEAEARSAQLERDNHDVVTQLNAERARY